MDLVNASPEIANGLRRLATVASTEEQGDGFIADALQLLAESLDLGMVYLTRVDEDTQYIERTHNRAGMNVHAGDSAPLRESYCIHLLQSNDRSLVIPNARIDPRCTALSATTEIGIGAYTGIQLNRSDGRVYGTLCTLHPTPRTPAEGEVELLSVAGRLIMQAVEFEEKQRARRERERELLDETVRFEKSARRRVEDELERSREDLRLAIDAGRLGIWELDLASGQFVCSARCRANFGLPVEGNFTSEALLAMIHPDDRELMRAAMRRAVEERQVFETEYRILWTDGSEHWILARGRPAYDAHGTPRRMLGFTLEITERKRADEAREAFFAAAAHDLKTPLTAIKGSAQYLRRRLTRTEGADMLWAARAAERIDSAGTRLLSAVNGFLDSSRIGTGQTLELYRTPVDLVGLVRQVAADQERQAVGRHISVNSCPEELVGMWDRFRLERVVNNLLGNAIRYSPNGGDIVVTLRMEGERPPRAVLCVQDSGIGISEADLPRIFERFYRGENVGHIAGTGIGLTGAKAIVEQHGGTICAKSNEGDGTTFTVSLPVIPWNPGENADAEATRLV